MLHYKKELSFMELELFSLNHTILSNGYQEFQVTFLNPDSIYELQLQLKFHDFTIDASPVIQFELVLLKELEDFLSSKNISYQNKYRFQENQIDLSWAGIQNYFQIDGDPGLLDDYASDLVFLLNITVTLHEAESTIFYLLKDNGNRFQILDDVKFNQNNIIFKKLTERIMCMNKKILAMCMGVVIVSCSFLCSRGIKSNMQQDYSENQQHDVINDKGGIN